MKPSYKPAVVLPQVEEFVAKRISKISADMKKMEAAADADTRLLSYEWHLTGQRPKVRNSQHFANMMNVSLRMQLSERDFAIWNIMGIVDHMTFIIEWKPRQPHVAHEETDRD